MKPNAARKPGSAAASICRIDDDRGMARHDHELLLFAVKHVQFVKVDVKF